jgi:cyclophilin family peptidyl-prolyl cis-trans isomerase
VTSLRMDKSMDVALVITGGIDAGKYTFSENTSGSMDLTNRRLVSSGKYSAVASGSSNQSMAVLVQVYTADGWSYLNGTSGPAGDVWLKTKVTNGLWNSQDQFTQQIGLLKNVNNATVQGNEKNNGAEQQVVQVTPNGDSLAKWMLWQSQELGLPFSAFNLPDSLKSLSVKEWLDDNSHLPARIQINALIEIKPGDLPSFSNDFDKMTLNVNSNIVLRDYGTKVSVDLPELAKQAAETTLGRLGVNEYLTYNPLRTTATPTETSSAPSLKKEGSVAQWPNPPAMTIDTNKTYAATVKTNLGNITITLFPKEAPIAVNNFVFLARQGFYDGVKFHRIIKGFVAQTGDPTGTGSGSAGYKFADEKVTMDYVPGTVAMANAGTNTNGSQFFICLADLSGNLSKSYTIFGRVTEGFETMTAIDNVPVTVGPTGEVSRPLETVIINSITIEEK